MAYVKVDIKKPAKGGAPQGKKAEIVIIDATEVAVFPARDDKGVVIDGAITFKDGKYAILLSATASSISLPVTSEGEEDAVGITSLPEFYHPGDSLEKDEFIQNWTNKNIIVAVKIGACTDPNSYYKVFGSMCNPLSLIVEGQDNNEATKTMIKFQQFTKSAYVPGRYSGTFTFDTANTVAADATTVDVVNGSGEYQLTDNTVPTALTDLTNASHGGVYTLIGSGGANPASLAASEAAFNLKDGVAWQGLAGSRITFKAYKNGASSYVFNELSRS